MSPVRTSPSSLPQFFLLASCMAWTVGCASESTELNDPMISEDGGLSAPAFFDQEIPSGARFAAGRVIVGLDPDAHSDELSLDGITLRPGRHLRAIDAAVYDLPSGVSVEEALATLRASGRHLFVEPDYERSLLVNDPYRPYQWNLTALEAETAWSMSTGSGVVVAVIDTGVSSGPADGVHGLLAGYDFVNDDADAADDQGHGSHVAGTVAQNTNNRKGVAGLAYDASILPVKVLDASGTGFVSDIVEGIAWAVDQGADVINLSLGASSGSAAEALAIANAWDSGVFVAAAAGNDGVEGVLYPAAYTGAVAVGATGYGEIRAPYSNYGTALDLAAPGGNLSEDANRDGVLDGIIQETVSSGNWNYYLYQGTSMASPHVAAAAALLMAQGATNEEALAWLGDTALDVGDAGWDPMYGDGFIQPADALEAFLSRPLPDTTPPVVSSVADSLARRKYTVTWTTDEDATSEVCVVAASRCTGTTTVLATRHSVRLSGRAGGRYWVRSADAAGNATLSGPYVF